MLHAGISSAHTYLPSGLAIVLRSPCCRKQWKLLTAHALGAARSHSSAPGQPSGSVEVLQLLFRSVSPPMCELIMLSHASSGALVLLNLSLWMWSMPHWLAHPQIGQKAISNVDAFILINTSAVCSQARSLSPLRLASIGRSHPVSRGAFEFFLCIADRAVSDLVVHAMCIHGSHLERSCCPSISNACRSIRYRPFLSLCGIRSNDHVIAPPGSLAYSGFTSRLHLSVATKHSQQAGISTMGMLVNILLPTHLIMCRL